MQINKIIQNFHIFSTGKIVNVPNYIIKKKEAKEKTKSMFSIKRKNIKADNDSLPMEIEYLVSPQVHENFRQESETIHNDYSLFSKVVGQGYFDSNINFHIHILRGKEVFSTEIEHKDEGGQPDDMPRGQGALYYIFMSHEDYLSFPKLEKAKTLLELDDLVELQYNND